MARYGMVVDLDRCIGCYNCQIACKDEHCGNDFSPIAQAQPTFGQFWMSIKEQERVISDSRIRVYYYPHMCNHCEDAPCIKAAKNGAIYKRDDGIVIIDPDKAVGQKELVNACPYGAIYANEELNLAQKCTMCAHLLDDGWDKPRCVQTCPTDCLIFGDLDDPNSRIAKFTAERKPGVLYPEHAGTKPKMTYAGLPKPIVSGCVVQGDNNECAAEANLVMTVAGGAKIEVKADNYGEFYLQDPAPGKASVTVSLAGYQSQTLQIEVSADVTNMGEIVLKK